MITFACVMSGDYQGRGWEYIAVLADMVGRNMPPGAKWRFVCLTDATYLAPAPQGVEFQPLLPGYDGWWNKLQLFKPGQFPNGDRIIYFDLDTVIVSDLDDLLEYSEGFAMLQDAYRPGGRQSSVMLWRAGDCDFIWEQWKKLGEPQGPGGDQEWLEKVMPNARVLQGLFPGFFGSYKVDCQGSPDGRSVVFFHGHPRPHEADGWVSNVWKIGGAKIASIKAEPNTGLKTMFKNVRSASKRPLDWIRMAKPNIAQAVIVGGGPSLERYVEEIRWRTTFPGQLVFALNRAAHYLFDAGIRADFQVIMDARPENVAFANAKWAKMHILSSTCHPGVFDRLLDAGANVSVFHPFMPGIEEHIPRLRRNDYDQIGGGTTVGLTTLAMAFVMGFRKMHLYGFDSSYKDKKLHAYEQKLTPDEAMEMEVVAGGRTFITTPTMVQQTRSFMGLANALAEQDCLITVHGDGLLPHLVKEATKPVMTDDKRKMIGGYWWPKDDNHASQVVLVDGPIDVPKVMFHVKHRRTAVQAGGNVGVYPRLLSPYFQSVLTFEPDKENYDCLKDNVIEPNIKHFNRALGDAVQDRMSMIRFPDNAGAHQMNPDTAIAINETSVDTIDRMALTDCDLIWLDIEGYELQALMGAFRTINQCKPVVVIEDKGLSDRYGVKQGTAIEWLQAAGYGVVEQIGRDYVLVHGGKDAARPQG